MSRKKRKQGLEMGRTLAAERERAESESERMQARKKGRRKKTTSVILMLGMLGILGYLAYMGVGQIEGKWLEKENAEVETPEVRAEIVDEDGRGQISARVKTYIGQLEEDFGDLGYQVTRVTLPSGMSRELLVNLAGVEGYVKINTDRGAAVSAEDAVRMVKYLQEKGVKAEYIDVRVEGKGYYK